jgi:hypothetical protein
MGGSASLNPCPRFADRRGLLRSFDRPGCIFSYPCGDFGDFVEVLGLVFGGASAIVGLATLVTKGIGALRSYDRQLEQLRLTISDSQIESERQRAQIREHLLKLEGAMALLRSEIGLEQSIATSPRRRHSSPIETDI